MAEKGTTQAYLDEVKKLVGTIGGDKIRKWYNQNVADIGSGKWFWCCATIVYCAVKAGAPASVIKHTASSSDMLNFFKAQGRYKSRESGYKPKAGDIIFFDYLPNDGMPASHIGTVEKYENGYVHTIEGNSGNKSDGEVMRHKYPLDYAKIRGYGQPNYKKPTPEKPILDKKGFKKGDNTKGILALKELLLIAKQKKLISAKLDENKTFGNGTEKAVNELLKKWGYSENGIAGENFIKKLSSYVK